MSTDPDKDTACPKNEIVVAGTVSAEGDTCQGVTEKKRKKPRRSVCFPEENHLVTQYFEPANPWHDVPTTTRAQLAAEYLEACRRHNTTPIDSVLQQIRELPENSIGGGVRAARLTLADCSLVGSAPADALEALLRKVQFRRFEVDHAEIDDEGAEAIFDMIEYYESAIAVCISGPRQFGIRGWQAASRMIKKSAEVSEVEICSGPLEGAHAAVLARALRPHSCKLRALTLQRAALAGDPLLCLVIALKPNASVRELRLPDNQLTTSDAQQLGSLLRFNTNIQLLDLSNNQIQDQGAGYIADALVEQAAQTPPSTATSPLSPHHYPLGAHEARGLAFLVLWNNQLTRNCAPHLSKALRSSQSLCVLNVGRNALGTEALRALQCGTALLSLGLQCARLGPEAANPLADLIRADTKLQRLDLRDNRLGVAGLQAIHTAMKENTTLTQIDLDDPAESQSLSEDSEAVIAARLTRDIRALCRRNEPPATEPERRVHRKISLTCHTACVAKTASLTAEPCRRTSRLRSPAPSPAPSPAGSPVPLHQHNSRFSVTRVTPERESSTESGSPSTPTRPTYCPTPSRFKVVQVAEPPQIHVHLAQKRPSSRFSVTRNYDTMYNPSPPGGSPRASPSPSGSPTPGTRSPTVGITVSPVVAGETAGVTSVSPSMTGVSPTREVLTGASPTVLTSVPPTVLTSVSPTVLTTASPTVLTRVSLTQEDMTRVSPAVKTTASHKILSRVSSSAGIFTSVSPTSGMTSGSPTVLTRLPPTSEMTGVSPTREVLPSVSPTVLTTEEPTVLSRLSPTAEILTSVSPTRKDLTSALPTVLASDSPTPGMLTSALLVRQVLTTATQVQENVTMSPNIVTRLSPDIMTRVSPKPGATQVPESSTSESQTPETVVSASLTILTRALTTVSPTLTTVSPNIAGATPTFVMVTGTKVPVASSVSPTVTTTLSPAGTLTTVSPTLTSLSPVPGTIHSNIPTTFIASSNMSPSKTKLSPSVSPALETLSTVPPLLGTSQKTDIKHGTNKKTIGTNTSPEKQVSTIVSENVPTISSALEKLSSSSKIGTSISPVCKTGTIIDPIWMRDVETVQSSEMTTKILSETPSSVTITGTEISGTNTVTISGATSRNRSISELENRKESEMISKHSNIFATMNEPIFKVGAGYDSANVGANMPSVDMLRSKLGPTIISESKDPPIVEPDSRLEISLIPHSFDSDTDKKDKEEIAKRIATGSQVNLAIACIDSSSNKQTNKATEITGPKLATEPKDIQAIDLDKTVLRDTSSEKSSVSRPLVTQAPITSKAPHKADVGFTKSIQLKGDDALAIEYKSKSTDTSDINEYSEEIIVEKNDDVKKESFNKSDAKSSRDELKTVDAELAKDITDLILKSREDISKEERSVRITESEKDSDAKKSDTSDVRNKTYSDVVKSDAKYKDKSEQLTHSEVISDNVVKSETKLVKNSVQFSDVDKVDVQIAVTVKKESVQAAKNSDQTEFVNLDDIVRKDDRKKQIETITEDLGNLIKEMRDISSKSKRVRSDCTVDIDNVIDTNKVPGKINRDVILKKNKSESSLDSPDLEVSRLMNKKLIGSPFCDSSSSLEISGSSMESLNAIENQHALVPKPIVIQESVESDTELDRRKEHVALSTESSIESASEVTPVNSGNLLNMSVSSNESVSPIIFGRKKKIHDSLSSLEASMSSLDSGRQEKVMVTSADSGIEYSLQHPAENKEDNSSNEGTLTHNSSLRETVKKTEQETLTSSPKRTSSLLDVPALKSKGLDRMRKISWVAPSSSFHIPRVEAEKVEKPSHLEKLLSLFQHPTSLFSRSQSDEERKSASNTPPRKDSSLTSSFWSWGSTIEKDRDEKEDSSEATDSTLSERVQVSFVDESFSKKLDSKTPSTDTDNTLSEFQSFPIQANPESDSKVRVTDSTTDENLVQKCLGLSLKCTDNAGYNGNKDTPKASDNADLSKPNDLNRNYEAKGDSIRFVDETKPKLEKDDIRDETKLEPMRPRSFAAVLKSSGSENTLDKQPSPDSGPPVDKLPSKVIRGIKENISPENTLTSSMTNTKTLAIELCERQIKNQSIVNAVWEVTNPLLDKSELKTEEVKAHSDLAPIATIEETCDEAADNTVNIPLGFIDDIKIDEKEASVDSVITVEAQKDSKSVKTARDLENVDLGKDALSYLIYESQDFEPDTEHTVAARAKVEEGSLAQELKEAEIKEMLDLSPELVIDEATEVPEVFTAKEIKGMKSSPVIPERAKLKKSNSLEDLSSQSVDSEKTSPKTKTIAFKVPESTSPRDIPRAKLRTMSGSSPKSLPESLNKPSPLAKMDSTLKKRKKVSSLGKMAKDSLLALNMSEEEIAEYRRSYVTSAESLRSLESVSEDANSQSGTSVDSRCRSCLRTSQESLMSLDSITDDCKCTADCDRPGRSAR